MKASTIILIALCIFLTIGGVFLSRAINAEGGEYRAFVLSVLGAMTFYIIAAVFNEKKK